MTQTVSDHHERFYSLLSRLGHAPGQGRPLGEIPKPSSLPKRGVYFFLEPGEFRTANASARRVVRVGTHAVSSGSKSTLHGRLKQHLGTRTGGGNHRGSIFRGHVGAALLVRDGIPLPTWGVGSSAPLDVRTAELAWENQVSAYIGGMSVLWINVPDEAGALSERAFIERNAIALLSNQFGPIDAASTNWLGRLSPKQPIRDSALWNVKHVTDVCDPRFLDKLESFVELTRQGAS